MSKYWCKPCQAFVLDTKVGRAQHEATWKHKSSIQRQLQSLHKENQQREKDSKDAARVLSEIEKEVELEKKSSAKITTPPSPSIEITCNAIKKRDRDSSPPSSSLTIEDPTPEQPKKKIQIRTSKGLSDHWNIEDKVFVSDDIPKQTPIRHEETPNKPKTSSLFKKRKPKT